MPSEKVLETKKEIVAGLEEKLKTAVSGVIVDYKGISVADDTKLRKELREAGVEYKVVKNTLLRFAERAGRSAQRHHVSGSVRGCSGSRKDPG